MIAKQNEYILVSGDYENEAQREFLWVRILQVLEEKKPPSLKVICDSDFQPWGYLFTTWNCELEVGPLLFQHLEELIPASAITHRRYVKC